MKNEKWKMENGKKNGPRLGLWTPTPLRGERDNGPPDIAITISAVYFLCSQSQAGPIELLGQAGG